ncbi:MAG: tetratricopeptide repeat protein [Candidatus Tectomicrobia bacterium]|nr:tetratricopeptide repeat protein [Candidatus Tectomicrobia bacterium]
MLASEAGARARALAASRLGLDFQERRQADLERGLLRAWRASPLPTPEAYLAWLEALPDENPEWGRLAGWLTVGETYFFRDRACVEALEREVLPSLIAARRAEGIPRLRLWSAGCSTGEEPCTLAILLDRLLPDRAAWSITVLATDINLEALESARRGLYREWALRETPAWTREKYFRRRDAQTFELDPGVRRMAAFAPLNLAADIYPSMLTNTSSMDLILCRNVLMYFTRGAQRAAVARLRRALAPGGWLVASPAEASTELFRPLAPVNFPGAIFYRNGPASAPPLPRTWEEEPARPPWPGPLPPVEIPAAPIPPAAPLESVLPGNEEKAPEPAPGTETLLQQGRSLAGRGELEKARRLCEAALAQERLDAEANLLLAEICLEQGEIAAALEALRTAIYLAPDSVPAHFLLGGILLREGDHKRGRRAMETVARLLEPAPPGEVVPGSDGLTAGRLLETARAHLDLQAMDGRGDARRAWKPEEVR